MKKMILSTVLCGSILVGMTSGITVQAEEVLSGNTKIGADVIAGDVTLTVDQTIEFGSKSLSDKVDFGSQIINYTVMDYSGTTNGFELSAKIDETDETRSLKIEGVDLSETAAAIITEKSNTVGENTNSVTSKLVYTGVTEVKKYTSIIEWNLTKAMTEQISE